MWDVSHVYAIGKCGIRIFKSISHAFSITLAHWTYNVKQSSALCTAWTHSALQPNWSVENCFAIIYQNYGYAYGQMQMEDHCTSKRASPSSTTRMQLTYNHSIF